MRNNDYRWFLANYDDIYKRYGKSYIVIKNETILGCYATYAEGVSATLPTEELGSFIVQKCTGDKTGYTHYINSKVDVRKGVSSLE